MTKVSPPKSTFYIHFTCGLFRSVRYISRAVNHAKNGRTRLPQAVPIFAFRRSNVVCWWRCPQGVFRPCYDGQISFLGQNWRNKSEQWIWVCTSLPGSSGLCCGQLQAVQVEKETLPLVPKSSKRRVSSGDRVGTGLYSPSGLALVSGIQI